MRSSEEIEQASIADLLELHPEEITDKQLESVISFLRERRALWAKEEMDKRKSGRKQPSRKAGTSAKSHGKVKLDLDDLDVQL